jgi:hypothetical protein
MLGHLSGFFAFASLPDDRSITPKALSPNSPFSVTSHAFISSPIIDLTGYLHNEAIVAEVTFIILLLFVVISY